MKARFIINPVAGKKNRVRQVTDAVRDVFASEDGIFEIKVASRRGQAAELAKEAVEKGFEAVFACGGDGTMNEVASRLVGTNTALGIAPLGSGNGFAKALGIPDKLPTALSLLKKWKIRGIDAGKICGRYFFSTAGCGFDAHLSAKYNMGALSSMVRGVLPYYPLALIEYMRYSPMQVTIQSGNLSSCMTPLILTAANTGIYGGGAVVAPCAEPDDGLLDLCIVPYAGFAKTLRFGAHLLSGSISGADGFETLRSERFEILRNGVSYVHADGEPFEWGGRVSISVERRRLKVLAT